MKVVLPATNTLVDLLRFRAETLTDKICYTYLLDGEDQEINVSYADFELKARKIAVALQRYCKVGDRALLIYRPGIEFVLGYFGCLFAGVIAVPVYPPAKPSDWQRFLSIAADCQPGAICTSHTLAELIAQGIKQFPDLATVPIICSDVLDNYDESIWLAPNISADHLAFLQYTSGSTGSPKGVMVSHKNLMHNERLIHLGFSSRPDFNMVSWLPLYHDMGLIGGAIQPVYLGFRTIFLSPVAFLQKPFRWLKAISKYRGNASGGPNFAYDLCVKRISEEQLSTLDLSCWEIAFNGAEPIRSGTLDRFAEKFACCGLDKNSIFTCYGLAEATLFVSGSGKGVFPSQLTVDAVSLAKNVLLEVDASEPTAKTLVSSGYVVEQDVRIVHPDTLQLCSEVEAGEIWVKSESVAKGYWNRPEATQETFNAYTSDSHEGPYLRTGDVGFLYKNQLYVTGRIKELVIVDGKNHYPQDLEDTIQSAHAELRRSCGAAFSIELNGQEKLVIVQELERRREETDLLTLANSVRKCVSENHDVQLHSIVFIEFGSLLKTSSGKIRRGAMRDLYINGGLKEIFRSELNLEPVIEAPSQSKLGVPSDSKVATTQSSRELVQKILELLAPHVGMAPHQIDSNLPFSHFGLDSRALVGLSGELEEKLGGNFSPHLFYNYPTVSALAHYLAGEERVPDEKTLRSPSCSDEAVAIIGMACRFPGDADSPEKFWQMLLANTDAISEVPEDRWKKTDYFDSDPTRPGKMNTKWGGFLKDVARFDAEFFNISPREAAYMDPQQRLLLEVSWETLENALISPERLNGSQTGVFIGVSSNDYGRLLSRSSSGYAGAGNAFSIAANRLSYFYDWHGPSVVVDTACSSSLVALHQACNTLLKGECHVALAGATNLILSPEVTVSFSQNRMMAADGRCKTFDDNADGYVRSEGMGMVLLKRLADAERDGDPICAIIRGSAVNQDGKTNGLTAPNGRAQEAVVKAALENARCNPEQIQYVECHGTGTRLGDPIEIYALNQAYGSNRDDRPLMLGAVKTNIGHLEAAAGMAGLIKAVMCLQNSVIPANLHFNSPNHQIEWDKMGLRPLKENSVVKDLEWAGVSSFGFGGTNAHVILQKYTGKKAENQAEAGCHLLPISAKDEAGLQRQIEKYNIYLTSTEEAWADICSAASLGRQHFTERAVLVADSVSEARDNVATKLQRAQLKARHKPRKVAFMFTGQGSQYLNMGRALFESNSVFRETLLQIDELSKTELEHALLSVLYPSEDNQQHMEYLISRTDYTQPALFAIEYALAKLWLLAGVTPEVVLGHSLGEFSAACIAGVFSLADAFKLVCARGRLMQALHEPGAMMAVFAHENDVRDFLDAYSDQVSIGAFNGPGQIVLSGKQKALQLLAQELEKRGIQSKVLRVSHGFHSPLMQPMMQAFSDVAKQVAYALPTVPILSNVTGRLENKIVANSGYWCAHVLSPVHFAQSMQTLEKESFNVIVEIGPKPTLIGMAKRCLPASDMVWLSSMDESNQGWKTFLSSVGQAYCEGISVDFAAVSSSSRPNVTLPNYEFSDTHFWIEDSAELTAPVSVKPRLPILQNSHPLLGRRLYSPRMKDSDFLYEAEVSIPGKGFFVLADKSNTLRINALEFTELAAAAHQDIFKIKEIQLRNLQFHDFSLAKINGPFIQQTFCTQYIGRDISLNTFVMESTSGSDTPEWKEVASALLVHRPTASQSAVESLNRLRTRFRKELDIEDYFESTRESGLKYCSADNPSLVRLWWAPNEALAEVKYREEHDQDTFGLKVRHSMVHACSQTLGAVCPRDGKGTYVPQAIDNVVLFADQGASGWIHIALRPHALEQQPAADITVYDSVGSVVAIFHGLRLVAAPVTRGLLQELKEVSEPHRVQLLEALLEKHISRTLKLNSPIDKSQVLTDLGLDSVMTMDIQSRIENKLSVSLNPTHFQRGATLYSLSRVVSDLFAQRYHLSGDRAGNKQDESSPLVEISVGDADKLPLFFVHPVGGSIFRYYDIGHYLGAHQPFYGLQSPSIAGVDVELNSIEEMATYYLKAIRKRQPQGPYMLGGWSMGGVIAFEIARQLYALGEDVSLLAIVDAIAPTDVRKDVPINDHVFVLKLLALDLGISERNLDIGYLSSLNEDDGLDYVYATAIASEALPASFSYREFKRRTALFRKNYWALSNYIAKPYSGAAHVFKAEVPFRDRRKFSATLDWDEVVAEIAQVKTLPGDHFTLMHRSHVNILATYLRAAIKNVTPSLVSENELDLLPEKYTRSAIDTVIRSPVKKKDGCVAQLVVDESHGYFYDHPLDHVSGILLIEAMNQLVERTVPSWRAKNAYIKHAKFTFSRFCEKQLPTDIVIEKAESQARWNVVNLIARQSGHSVCQAKLAVATNGAPQLGSAEIMRVNLADAKYLHKSNSENVLISTPETKDDGVFFCRALPPVSRHILASGDPVVFPILYWFEVARQFITYLSHDFYCVPFGSPMNLVSVEFSMVKPLVRGVNYTLVHRATDKELLSFRNFAHFDIQVMQDDDQVGKISLVAQVLDKKDYQELRYSEK